LQSSHRAFEREFEVALLALFCATTKKDDYLLALFPPKTPA
jgi:hypothetical protein